MRRFLLVMTMFISACATLSPSPRETVEQFVHAFNQLDAKKLRPLFAEDATAFLPMAQHASRVDGREAILAILGPLLEADRQRRNGVPLSLEVHDLALQQNGKMAVATFDIGTADVHSRRTLVLRQQGGRWRIIHLHASNVRP